MMKFGTVALCFLWLASNRAVVAEQNRSADGYFRCYEQVGDMKTMTIVECRPPRFNDGCGKREIESSETYVYGCSSNTRRVAQSSEGIKKPAGFYLAEVDDFCETDLCNEPQASWYKESKAPNGLKCFSYDTISIEPGVLSIDHSIRFSADYASIDCAWLKTTCANVMQLNSLFACSDYFAPIIIPVSYTSVDICRSDTGTYRYGIIDIDHKNVLCCDPSNGPCYPDGFDETQYKRQFDIYYSAMQAYSAAPSLRYSLVLIFSAMLIAVNFV